MGYYTFEAKYIPDGQDEGQEELAVVASNDRRLPVLLCQADCVLRHVPAAFSPVAQQTTFAPGPSSRASTNLAAPMNRHPCLRPATGVRFVNGSSMHAYMFEKLNSSVLSREAGNSHGRARFMSIWLKALDTDWNLKSQAGLHYEADQAGAGRIFLAQMANLFLGRPANFIQGHPLSDEERGAGGRPVWMTAKQVRGHGVPDWSVMGEDGKMAGFLEWKRQEVLTNDDIERISKAARARLGFRLWLEPPNKIKSTTAYALSDQALKVCLQIYAECCSNRCRVAILHNGSHSLLFFLADKNRMYVSKHIARDAGSTGPSLTIMGLLVGIAAGIDVGLAEGIDPRDIEWERIGST